MRYKQAEEIILLKEVVAFKAHVFAFGLVQRKFDLDAQAMNENQNFRFNVKGRTVKEKFNKMLVSFKKEDTRDRKR